MPLTPPPNTPAAPARPAPKNPLASRTTYGWLLLALQLLNQRFELIPADMVPDTAHAVVTVLGLVLVAIGRWRANQPLALTAPLKTP